MIPKRNHIDLGQTIETHVIMWMIKSNRVTKIRDNDLFKASINILDLFLDVLLLLTTNRIAIVSSLNKLSLLCQVIIIIVNSFIVCRKLTDGWSVRI